MSIVCGHAPVLLVIPLPFCNVSSHFRMRLISLLMPGLICVLLTLDRHLVRRGSRFLQLMSSGSGLKCSRSGLDLELLIVPRWRICEHYSSHILFSVSSGSGLKCSRSGLDLELLKL